MDTKSYPFSGGSGDLVSWICPSCLRRVPDDVGAVKCPDDGTALLRLGAVDDDRRLGTVLLDRYLLLSVLGKGGMGVVYRAYQLSPGRPVALKLLRPELATRNASVLIERFRREAQVTASLRSPHTVTLLDFGVLETDEMFMVLELIAGISMGELLRQEGQLTPERARQLLLQVCLSLEEAHASGLVHRDLKPDNVMLETLPDGSDFARVLDFGVAKVAEADEAQHLTQSGASIGTPAYMSPEQALGGEVGPTTDIYSLGVMGFVMLSGRLPFVGETAMKVMLLHIHEQPKTLEELGFDTSPYLEMGHILERCLQKAPEARYSSCAELRAALDEVAPLTAGAPVMTPGDVEVRRASLAAALPPTMTAETPRGSSDAVADNASAAAPLSTSPGTGLAEGEGMVAAPPAVGSASSPPRWMPFVVGGAVAGGIVAVALLSTGSDGTGLPPSSDGPPARAERAQPDASLRPTPDIRAPDIAPTHPTAAAADAIGSEIAAGSDASSPKVDARSPTAKEASSPTTKPAQPGPAPPRHPKPKQRPKAGRILGASITSASMSKARARGAMRSLKAQALKCWRKASGKPEGPKVTVMLYVGSKGAVKRVGARPSGAVASKVKSCVKGRALSLKFPALEGESFASVKVTVGP